MKNKGIFVVVDGPSASGKDTIIKQVIKNLKKLDINTISIEETKEKNYDRKKILLAKEKGDKEVARVIISQRKKIYEEKVIPELSKDIVIIANRGETTTLGYQTLHELTMQEVWDMHRALDIPIPDLIVITNCSDKEAIRRENIRQSIEEKDKNFMSGKFTDNNHDKRKQIHTSYEKVKNFLENKGIFVIYLNTDTMNIQQESKIIIDYIKKRYE